MRRIVGLALVVLSVALWVGKPCLAAAAQQEVTLKDGRVFKGDVVQRDGVVTIVTGDGRLFQFSKDETRSIVAVTLAPAEISSGKSPAPVQVAQSSGPSPAAPASPAVPTPAEPSPAAAPAAPASAAPAADAGAPEKTTGDPQVVLQTSSGDIKLELFEDDAPNTVANFVSLVEKGFYDGTHFHRILKGFMMQGGDPNTKGTEASSFGKGGPGYCIDDECGPSPKRKNERGMISMANAGAHTNGSQFFILFQNSDPLNGKHTVFGKVVEGMNVVDEIEKTAGTIGEGTPLAKITLTKAKVLRKRDHKYEPVKNDRR